MITTNNNIPLEAAPAVQEKKSDVLVKLAVLGELTGIVSDAYWFANFLDLVVGNDEDVFGLSYYGIVFGAALAIVSSIGSAYCHKQLNSSAHEASDNNPATASINIPNEHTLLNTHPVEANPPAVITVAAIQKIALIGNMIARAADIASGPTFVVKLATHNALPKMTFFLINLAALIFGLVCGAADTRVCYTALRKQSALKQHPIANENEASNSLLPNATI
ncbi:MAG: hypothetical protein Q8L78_06860 [Coxiellaceae bacterium]|nr:hypothetical protein [Coxiellaceae bacterium]